MAWVLVLVAARDKTTLTDATLARVRDAAEGRSATWLSAGEAAEIACTAPPTRALIEEALDHAPVDQLCVPARGRQKAVLVADMDSTIVTGETLDDLADEAGIGERIAAITKRSMEGEIDFAEALRERVALLEGLDVEALERTWARVAYTEGARELVATMRGRGATTALVSGGFTFFTERVARDLGFDVHHANALIEDGGKLTGKVAEPILDRDAKLATLRSVAAARGARLRAALAVGDGANDLAMIGEAGMGIAFRGKRIVAERAKLRVDHADLRALLFAQGYPASAFRPG